MDRKDLKIPTEDFNIAAKITGKLEPVEIFRELIRLATKQPSEKDYWQTRLAKDRVLKEELHLAKEIQAMTKEEVDKILQTQAPQLPEIVYCYICHKNDHWPSQCEQRW